MAAHKRNKYHISYRARETLDQSTSLKRVKQTLEKKLTSTNRHSLIPVMLAVDDAYECAMLLLQQERDALAANDAEYGDACRAEIDRLCTRTYAKCNVYKLLTAEEVGGKCMSP